MGTNYYRRRIVTEEDKRILHRLIDEGRLFSNWQHEEPTDSVNNYLSYLHEEIHLCKMSAGWQVCFDHNDGKYYQPNSDSLNAFLAEPNTIIVDEYGEEYTPERFWEIVTTHNSNSRNVWTERTYREWEKTQRANWYQCDYLADERHKCKEMFGVTTNDNDFIIDGLRFAVYTDFS